ncbi:ABC transporter ATP-binding protein [Micromonospora sp. DSM 115977]|uniref:ABC transporter ATP-binding protein n=1 Tax=Micromonospora reichwaldensis TaxID=3075516 RepID=A0ABU2X3K2_9ACTN|nr:ABC transporter ATP-binding protein [Micromonospora sp. DSM 115977]
MTAALLGCGLLLLRHATGGALQQGGPAATADSLVPLAVGMVAFAGLGGTLRAIANTRQRVLMMQLDRHVVGLVLDAATRADITDFEDPDFHDRMQRAVFASRGQAVMVVTTVVAVVQTALALIAVTATFLLMAWWLLPFALISALPAVKAARDERRDSYGLNRDLAENRRKRQYLERLMTGRDEAKEIRALGLGPLLRERWNDRYGDEARRTTTTYRRHLRRQIAARWTGDAFSLAVVAAVWWAVTRSVLDLPTALTAMTGLWLLSARMQIVGSLFNNVGSAALYLHDLRTFITDSAPQPTAVAPAPFRSLRALGVSFTYPGADRPALQDVTVRLEAGQLVALVGANGSGKTTLAKILSGLYRPAEGRLDLNGEPVTDLGALRAQTAVVFQDFVRYRFSAMDNIAFGRPDVPFDPRGVRTAAEQAGAHGFLTRLRHGYDTMLSKEFSDGSDLSLGQWQRLAIARAFYRDAPLVVLDEPTASLDPDAEAELFAHLRELFRGRTVLLISHRLASVRHADAVYVLQDGRIVEHGTHESLTELGGTYARLYRTQADAYQKVPS